MSSTEETVSHLCEWCDKQFTRPLPQGEGQRFCSKSCAAKHQHANKDKPHDPTRARANVREFVLDRDDSTCQRCGSVVECEEIEPISEAEVHHIIPKMAGGTDHPRNLVTLCKRCHKKAHRDMRKIPEHHPELLEELRDVVCEDGGPDE